MKDLTPLKCQEEDCTNGWSAVTITREASIFRCWYHWLKYYAVKGLS